MVGKKFGSWEVVEVVKGNKANNWQPMWLCRCECGAEKLQHKSNLTSGRSTACRKCSPGRVIHRLTGHKLYSIWTAMKQRCTNPDNEYYHNYGARGIKVFKEWENDPEAFINWCIENGWKKGLQLDRKENDGDYCPDNCRFISQGRNLRNSRTLSKRNTSGYRGVKKIVQRTQTVYLAAVTFNDRAYRLGHFKTPEEAARVRDDFCVRHKFPLPLNFPKQEHDKEKIEEEMIGNGHSPILTADVELLSQGRKVTYNRRS